MDKALLDTLLELLARFSEDKEGALLESLKIVSQSVFIERHAVGSEELEQLASQKESGNDGQG